jgi:hypothetical protein
VITVLLDLLDIDNSMYNNWCYEYIKYNIEYYIKDRLKLNLKILSPKQYRAHYQN